MVDVLKTSGQRATLSKRSLEAGRPSWSWRSVGCAALCLPAVLLTGCPQQGAPVKAPAQKTAPALPATIGANAVNAQQPIANTEQSRKVQALMQQVDKSYNSGVQNYRSGRLDAARLDFDYAVDLMLTSGIDIKNDATLNEEFERTVNAVNALEMDALKQGNGFSPKTEETPLESAGDLTFPPDAALAARLSKELNTTSDLPLVINDTVAGYINGYANSSSFNAHMRRSLERAGRYRGYIQQVRKEEGVPQDLIYLAVAESGFQLQVVNASSGAGGMWQFMPTGAYGLARNGYFDERFDPEKSSRAYARYIKQLYNQFGDWYLAMAAYDWGPGNVQRAVMRTGYADYWELYRRNAMPRETRNYVPQILAAIIMAKNPTRYGLDRVMADSPIELETVPVDYAMDLRLVADVTGSTLANIVSLNPALLRLNTPSGIRYDLHIPKGTTADFNTRIAAIPVEKRASWRFHEVRTGESLDQVAQLFHVSAHDIRVANDLEDTDPVGEGDEIVVPLYSATTASTRHLQYTAQSGDSLITIADRFNVSTEELRSWNHLDTTAVDPGTTLYVSEPVRLPPAGRGHVRGRGRSYNAVRGRGHASRGRAGHGGSVAATRSSRGASRGSVMGRGSSRGAAAASRGSGSGTRGAASHSSSARTAGSLRSGSRTAAHAASSGSAKRRRR